TVTSIVFPGITAVRPQSATRPHPAESFAALNPFLGLCPGSDRQTGFSTDDYLEPFDLGTAAYHCI
ncbi:hypothetical protein, partial [Bradyrhizobium sp. sGM-13]|uniref:hypothetical protein n=1 Tax=Bradyrhizobium sp. sGM-13 TaxID=2831781 RepID=UPI001BD08888